jgi:hypothetical protein
MRSKRRSVTERGGLSEYLLLHGVSVLAALSNWSTVIQQLAGNQEVCFAGHSCRDLPSVSDRCSDSEIRGIKRERRKGNRRGRGK